MIKVFRRVKPVARMRVAVAMLVGCTLSALALADPGPRSPIRHLVMIIGENHSFDNLFGAYSPDPHRGQNVMNLLSEKIITSGGTPGLYLRKAEQWQATVEDKYSIAPTRTARYALLPRPNTTVAFGQTPGVPDVRFPADLPNGPFQISKYTAYQLSYTGDPAHRFFQMWQQYDEGRNDLFVWGAVTIGFGSDGKSPPAPFTDQSTHQGGLAMGFYNMTQGDAPVFKFLPTSSLGGYGAAY